MNDDQLTWAYGLEENTEEAASDNIQRPPLVGKALRVPEGLYDLDWSKTKDAYGKGTLTPYYIEGLASDNEGDRRFAAYGLYSATTHQGSVYTASKKAIPFLVDLLEAEKQDRTIMACHFLSRIALGESHFIRTPEDVVLSKSKYYKDVLAHQAAILRFYQETNSEEALRLLCFFPNALPDDLDISVQGDSLEDYAKQASTLLVQGFLAQERKLTKHLPAVKTLMEESPSLLVQGAAAICRAYSGDKSTDVMALLLSLSGQELPVFFWCWDSAFNEMAKVAWLYAADLDLLLHTATPFEYEKIVQLSLRLFPPRQDRQYTLYRREDLTGQQMTLLRELAEKDPHPPMLGSYLLDGVDLPDNRQEAMRILEPSGQLCRMINSRPLWHTLQMFVQGSVEKAAALAALIQADPWEVLTEVYHPKRKDQAEERCTLSLHARLQEKAVGIADSKIIDLFADLVEADQVENFLERWLMGIEGFENGYDFAFRAPAQRIGVCLLALCRTGRLREKYYPLVRPYHLRAQFSRLPLDILAEILKGTSQAHQAVILKEHKLLNKYIGA